MNKYDNYNKTKEYNNILNNYVNNNYNKTKEYNDILNNYVNNNNYINYISNILVKEIVNVISLNFSKCPKDTYNYYIDYFIEQNLNNYYKENLNDIIYDNIVDYISKYKYKQKKFIDDNDYNFIENYTENFLNNNYIYLRLCINNSLQKYKK